MKLFSTDSLIAFSLICICLSPFVVRLPDQLTQAELSLYTTVGADMISSVRFSPSTIWFKCCKHFVHLSVAYISASAELLAVIVYLLEQIQCNGPPK
jgi:hypothetical protein